MKFAAAIDVYIADMRTQGRLNSSSSERGYRSTLLAHAEDVSNRDPAYVARDDVKRTLRRWANANTQGTNRAKLVSFYDWTMEEGLRRDNPARQTRRPRRRPALKYRLTEAEALGVLNAALGTRERRAIFLGLCAGLRNAELRGLQGRHFDRPGLVWVSTDIGKGKRERWVPVIPDLAAVVDEIRQDVGEEEYVLPAQRFRDPPFNTRRQDLRLRPSASQALRELVMRVVKRAGIAEHVRPHDLRHAYAEHIARATDTRIAQHLLGHANLGTTDTYLGRPRIDDLVAAVQKATYGVRTNVLGVAQMALVPHKATTGIEPV
ncbi:MAG: tyrosine-type recombinase/integrase [Solirubrobacteraceae bacterium]